jgi:hypothetical protein
LRRDPLAVQRRFVRRARQLGCACVVTERARKPAWKQLWRRLHLTPSMPRLRARVMV